MIDTVVPFSTAGTLAPIRTMAPNPPSTLIVPTNLPYGSFGFVDGPMNTSITVPSIRLGVIVFTVNVVIVLLLAPVGGTRLALSTSYIAAPELRTFGP